MNTNETAKWLSCPLPASVLCTAVTPRRTKPSITFPRTQYGMLSLGSQQGEPQKPRQRFPPTNASARRKRLEGELNITPFASDQLAGFAPDRRLGVTPGDLSCS